MISEQYIIDQADFFLKTNNPNLKKGIGDDTAVFTSNESTQLFTADMLVEGTHFLFDKIKPYSLGWKSLAVNVSDIAAMNGEPTFATLSLGLKDSVTEEWVSEFFRGISDCAKKFNVTIVGGDTVSAPLTIINISLLGTSKNTIYRNNIKPDYVLVSTGVLGLSSIGLEVLLTNDLPFDQLYEKYWLFHCEPEPRLLEAQFLASEVENLSMMDCSDGLYQSCETFNLQNKLGIVISDPTAFFSEEMMSLASNLNFDLRNKFIFGGEDYEILAAMPESDYLKVKPLFEKKFQKQLIKLGVFNSDYGKIQLKDQNDLVELNNYSFQHFK